MNIDELTIGEAKQLANQFGSAGNASGPSQRLVGKYVIIRSRNEGINAGTIVEADETGVVLSGARRLWHHKPKVVSESWYEGVANHGLSSDSRISAAVLEKVIIEGYSVTLCTDIAKQSIEMAAGHAQT